MRGLRNKRRLIWRNDALPELDSAWRAAALQEHVWKSGSGGVR